MILFMNDTRRKWEVIEDEERMRISIWAGKVLRYRV